MKIDREVCIGCKACIPYCPVAAIRYHKSEKDKGTKARAEIDRDHCVECSVCFRAQICPAGAILDEALPWPRILRRAFSDPFHEHKGTNVPGRGTEEMKTNEVTGRFKEGFIGVGLEFGRPGVGVRLGETEKAIGKLTQMGVGLEPLNPLTQLIENPQTGELKEEVKNEKVLSAIVEFTIPIERAQEIFAFIKDLASEVDTVFSLDLINKVGPEGTIPILKEAKKAGFFLSVNGKVNVGLGRPLYDAQKIISKSGRC
jgi:ferredoxin